jgi:hypothetical protein
VFRPILITDEPVGDFEVVLEMNNDFGPDSGLFLRSTEDGTALMVRPGVCRSGCNDSERHKPLEWLRPPSMDRRSVHVVLISWAKQQQNPESVYPSPVSPVSSQPGRQREGPAVCPQPNASVGHATS